MSVPQEHSPVCDWLHSNHIIVVLDFFSSGWLLRRTDRTTAGPMGMTGTTQPSSIRSTDARVIYFTDAPSWVLLKVPVQYCRCRGSRDWLVGLVLYMVTSPPPFFFLLFLDEFPEWGTNFCQTITETAYNIVPILVSRKQYRHSRAVSTALMNYWIDTKHTINLFIYTAKQSE